MKNSKKVLQILDQKADQFANRSDSRFPLHNSISRFDSVDGIGFRHDLSEEPFLEWLVSCLPEKGHLLDIGSGDGRVALKMRKKGLEISCLEPAENRAQELRKQGFKVYQKSFMDFASDLRFDHVLFCRSIGLAAIQDGKIQLSKALMRAAELSTGTIIMVMPPEEILVHKAFRRAKLPLFKRPIFEFHLLQLLSLQVPINQISHSYYVTETYQSLEDCLRLDFSKTSWDSVQLDHLNMALKDVLGQHFERRVHWMVRYCEVNAEALIQAFNRG